MTRQEFDILKSACKWARGITATDCCYHETLQRCDSRDICPLLMGAGASDDHASKNTLTWTSPSTGSSLDSVVARLDKLEGDIRYLYGRIKS
jgi:hypothetical protein